MVTEGFSAYSTIMGTTSTILDIFKEASDVIPVPYVKPLVESVASLLTAVKVGLQSLVSAATNDY